MSNRDGRTAHKQSKNKWRRGKKCPHCGKGVLTSCCVSKHKHCALCKVCGRSNF
jgi:transcription elongation factor Elf1